MIPVDLRKPIIDFLDNKDKFVGKQIEIIKTISYNQSYESPAISEVFEYNVIAIYWTFSGSKLVFEGGNKNYFICLDLVRGFTEVNVNEYCFVERYGDEYKKTDIKFS